MKTIDLSTQTPTIEEILAMARTQAGILLARNGEALAQVLPIGGKAKQRKAPLHPGAWDVREDFDELLSEEFLLGRL